VCSSDLQATSGDLVVRWSYAGFHRSTPIDIEAARGDGVFQRLARTVVDDGTPGYFGSHTVDTTSLADGTDYTVRVRMPTRPSVTSSASPVTVDNTGPASTVTAESATEPLPPTAVTTDVQGTATDAVSAVASVSVTFTDAGGNEVAADVTCDCAGPSAAWAASTDGLSPGHYSVTAVATDALGNVGAPASADMVIVGTPEDPTPAVLETVNGVLGTATGMADDAVETSTGIAGDAVETVTSTTIVEDTVETVTGTTVADPTATGSGDL
jgi:hypothetical protein